MGPLVAERMKVTQRQATTAKSKETEDLAQLKASFLSDVVATVVMEEIPPELIQN